MSGLITSIVVGIVVAVVGAIAAYYLGGLREKQKQEADQSKHRVEVLTEIRSQCSIIVEDVRNWAAKAAALPDSKPLTNPAMDDVTFLEDWRNFYALCGKTYKQGYDISPKMSSLKTYFENNEHQLATTTRNAFENFEQDFYKRCGSLKDAFATSKDRDYTATAHIGSLPTKIGDIFAAEDWEAQLDNAITVFDQVLLGTKNAHWYEKFGLRETKQRAQNEFEDGAKEILRKISKAATYAQDWDAQPYLDALNKEITKYAKTEV